MLVNVDMNNLTAERRLRVPARQLPSDATEGDWAILHDRLEDVRLLGILRERRENAGLFEVDWTQLDRLGTLFIVSHARINQQASSLHLAQSTVGEVSAGRIYQGDGLPLAV